MFKGFCTAQEVDFKDYMKLQYKSYIDGKADFEVEYQIETASNDYKLLVEKWDMGDYQGQ
jgi:hypothetical protein